jgi:hypothetical protein
MPDPKTPGEDEGRREQDGEDARQKLDEAPAPGTDPLHDGP